MMKIKKFLAIKMLTLVSMTIISSAPGMSVVDNMSFSGYGTAGNISKTNNVRPELAFDWMGRAQYYKDRFGTVLSFNQVSERRSGYLQDLFLFFDVGSGRIEVGHTNSVGQKLGVGLPDAGGLRINQSMMAYGLIDNPNVIATPSVNSSANKPRVAYVARPSDFLQYGFGAATGYGDMDFGADAGIRLRGGEAVKYGLSFGVSHIINPDGLLAEIYAPRVTADSRSEGALGINIQYNSWSIGLVGKAIYDYNPAGRPSDGIMYGAGGAYEFLSWRASLNVLRSDTAVWRDCDYGGCANTTVLTSVQNKLDEIVDLWASFGRVIGDESFNFWSVSLRAKF